MRSIVRSPCSAEPGPGIRVNMDPGSAAHRFTLRSVRGTTTAIALQHLMHVNHDAVGVARGGGDEQALHQPAVFFATGLKPRRGAEIDQFGIDRLAALQPLQQLNGAETDAPVLDIDHRAVVGLEGVFRLELDQLVGPDDLEVGAERADLAVDGFAAHLTAGDRNDAADAGADIAGGGHAADLGGDGEDIAGRKLWFHGITQSCAAAARSPAMETESGSPAGSGR